MQPHHPKSFHSSYNPTEAKVLKSELLNKLSSQDEISAIEVKTSNVMPYF